MFLFITVLLGKQEHRANLLSHYRIDCLLDSVTDLMAWSHTLLFFFPSITLFLTGLGSSLKLCSSVSLPLTNVPLSSSRSDASLGKRELLPHMLLFSELINESFPNKQNAPLWLSGTFLTLGY